MYQFYFDQLAGKMPETRLPHQPEAGFYRAKRSDAETRAALKSGEVKGVQWSAVAIWKDGDEWCCEKQFGRSPTHQDEICELFASICRNAIPEDVYRAVTERGEPWPDEVAERAAPAPENERAVTGDNSGEVAPFDIMRERIADVGAQVKAWLAEIGGTIKTQEQADKAANFADLFAEIEKEATAAHKVEKEPILKRGREIDGAWKPVIELADGSKRKAKGLLTPFLIEQKRLADESARIENERLREEARKAQEAARAAAEQGEEAPAPVAPPPTVAPAQVKAGTRGRVAALRTVKRAQIDDLPALVAYLAAIDPAPADLVEVATKLAYRIMTAGVTVPGAILIQEQVAA